ncbi:MAG: hypothetical protein QXH30_00605 [Candidatus Bilamarchaeaceae archaeon]
MADPVAYGTHPMLPGQGLPSVHLVGGCEGCPPPESLTTMVFVGYSHEQNLSSATLAAESADDKRFPVKDATIFVQVFYKEGGKDTCRVKTNDKGEANFSFAGEPYSACKEDGCTIRFTFCCPNLTEGGCLIPACLSDESISGYGDVQVCPGYSESGWPEEAMIMVNATEAFYPLYPSIGEVNVPPKTPDIFGAFSFGFCLPVLVIFGLLSAAMFASGRNPFAMFSFYTPQFKRGTERMMRGRGLSWNISGIVSQVTSVARGVQSDIKSAVETGKKTGSVKMAIREGTTLGRGVMKPSEAFSHLTVMGKGEALKREGVYIDRKTGAMIMGGDQATASFGRIGKTFRNIAETAPTIGGKAGALAGGTLLILGTAIATRMARYLGPVDIVMTGIGSWDGVLGVMARAIEVSGSDRSLRYYQQRRNEINMKAEGRDGKLALSFMGEDGKRHSIEYDDSQEGRRALAAKQGELMKEIEVGEAAAAALCKQKEKSDVLSVAKGIAPRGMDAAKERAQQSSAFKSADKDGDGKLSKPEFEAAMGKAKDLGTMATFILAYEGFKGDVPKKYLEALKQKAEGGKLTAEEFSQAAFILLKSASEAKTAKEAPNAIALAALLSSFQAERIGSREAARGAIGERAKAAADLAIGASACIVAADAIARLKGPMMVSISGPEGGRFEVSSATLAGDFAHNSIKALALTIEAGNYSILPAGERPSTDEQKRYASVASAYGTRPHTYVYAADSSEAANRAVIERVKANAMYGLSYGPQGLGEVEQYAAQAGLFGPPEKAEKFIRELGEHSALALAQKINDPLASAEAKMKAREELVDLLVDARLSEWGADPARFKFEKKKAEEEAAAQGLKAGTPAYENAVDKILQKNYGITRGQYAEMLFKAEADIAAAERGFAQLGTGPGAALGILAEGYAKEHTHTGGLLDPELAKRYGQAMPPPGTPAEIGSNFPAALKAEREQAKAQAAEAAEQAKRRAENFKSAEDWFVENGTSYLAQREQHRADVKESIMQSSRNYNYGRIMAIASGEGPYYNITEKTVNVATYYDQAGNSIPEETVAKAKAIKSDEDLKRLNAAMTPAEQRDPNSAAYKEYMQIKLIYEGKAKVAETPQKVHLDASGNLIDEGEFAAAQRVRAEFAQHGEVDLERKGLPFVWEKGRYVELSRAGRAHYEEIKEVRAESLRQEADNRLKQMHPGMWKYSWLSESRNDILKRVELLEERSNNDSLVRESAMAEYERRLEAARQQGVNGA